MPPDLSARPDLVDQPGDRPLVTAIVVNEPGELLLVHNTDNDLWAIPGGGMDLGEYMAETVVREVKEKTGIDVEVTGVVGIHTNPNHVMAYDDGEVRQQCSICFTTRILGGELRTSSETKEVCFVDPAELERLNIYPSMRLRIQHYLERRPAPSIGSATPASCRAVRSTAPASTGRDRLIARCTGSPSE